MKHILYLLFIVMSLGVNAQSHHYEKFDVDTITDAGAVTFTVTKQMKDAGVYAFYAQCDSLTGATNATASYQVATLGGTTWIQVATGTVNGVQSFLSNSGVLYGDKYRVVITGSGTQSTKITPIFVFKRDR